MAAGWRSKDEMLAQNLWPMPFSRVAGKMYFDSAQQPPALQVVIEEKP